MHRGQNTTKVMVLLKFEFNKLMLKEEFSTHMGRQRCSRNHRTYAGFIAKDLEMHTFLFQVSYDINKIPT